MDLLVFSLDTERCAVPVGPVARLVRAVAISRLPGAPRVIEGAINVRGTLVPVLDLRRRFGLTPRPVALSDILIIMRSRSRTVAIRAAGDAHVLQISADDIQAPGDVYPNPQFVCGIARLPDGLLVIQDVDNFLFEAESTLLDQALASAEAQHPDYVAAD